MVLMENKKTIRYFLIVLFSLFSTFGLSMFFTYGVGYLSFFANSFISILVCLLYTMVYNKIKTNKKNIFLFTILFSIFLSFILVLGFQLEYFSDIYWNFKTVRHIFYLIFSIFPLVNNFTYFIDHLDKGNSSRTSNKNNRYVFFVLFFFHFLVFLALYPGIFTYDNYYMLRPFFFKEYVLSSHYPIPLSATIYFIMCMGKKVFGTYQMGFSIFILLQNIFLSYVSTKITLYVKEKSKSKIIFYFSLLFFSFFPCYTVLVNSCTSDSIFAGLFSLYILYLLKLCEDINLFFQKKKNTIFLFIIILLLCFTRNNGIYCILFTIPVLFILFRDRWKSIIVIFVIPLFLFSLYSGPFFELLGIEHGSSTNEILSVPSFQLARVYTKNRRVFKGDDLQKLSHFYEDLKEFDYYHSRPSNADNYKNTLIGKSVTNNFLGYIGLWLKIGIRDPKNYIEAFLLGNLGLWYPNKNYYDSRMRVPYIEYDIPNNQVTQLTYIKKNSLFPLYNQLIKSIIYDDGYTGSIYKNIPVFSTLFTPGIYFVFFLFLFSISIIKKKYKYLIPLFSVFSLFLTIVFAPVIVFRYCFPIVMLLPIFITMLFNLNDCNYL